MPESKSSSVSTKRENIGKMKEAPTQNRGFDVVIIVSSNENSQYWQERLRKTRKDILPDKAKIISIEETQPIGQLLGTLEAFEKANQYLDGTDLKELLDKGKTVAIYHTAGQGKRMAPLVGTEANNKPAIKLPKIIETDEEKKLLTLLESVVFSTQPFAETREGRVCVFWGDQVIIPSRQMAKETDLPIEIFGIEEEMNFNRQEWEKNWQKYGILIPQEKGVIQREKLEWEKAKQLQEKGYLQVGEQPKARLAKSMGCFSLRACFLQALLEEFSKELQEKDRKLDTDPDLWMPLTSSKEEYEGEQEYWAKINDFRERFQEKEGIPAIIGKKDLGEKTLWWDYGNLNSYCNNLLKVLADDEEGKEKRKFYGIEDYLVKEEEKDGLQIKNSVIINSEVKQGKVENCLILNSKINEVKAENSIIFNSSVQSMVCNGALGYNLKEEAELRISPREIIADIELAEKGKVRMRTDFSRDGKKDWSIKLPFNYYSYEEIEEEQSKP